MLHVLEIKELNLVRKILKGFLLLPFFSIGTDSCFVEFHPWSVTLGIFVFFSIFFEPYTYYNLHPQTGWLSPVIWNCCNIDSSFISKIGKVRHKCGEVTSNSFKGRVQYLHCCSVTKPRSTNLNTGIVIESSIWEQHPAGTKRYRLWILAECN